MELHSAQQFETEIFAKNFVPARLRQELASIPLGEAIAIGSATDPYQPAERRFLVTRRMLEVFATTSGFRIGITTKSDLIVRDLPLLQELRRRHRLHIAMTITTVDAGLARLLEPMAPRPDLRIAAVKKLVAAGIPVRISCAPILPLINDSDESLDAVVHAGANAGACDVWGGVLFLNSSAQAVFLPFLEKQYPHIVARYKERYAHSAYLRGDYPEQIDRRLKKIRAKYGLPLPKSEALPELWPTQNQFELFGEPYNRKDRDEGRRISAARARTSRGGGESG